MQREMSFERCRSPGFDHLFLQGFFFCPNFNLRDIAHRGYDVTHGRLIRRTVDSAVNFGRESVRLWHATGAVWLLQRTSLSSFFFPLKAGHYHGWRPAKVRTLRVESLPLAEHSVEEIRAKQKSKVPFVYVVAGTRLALQISVFFYRAGLGALQSGINVLQSIQMQMCGGQSKLMSITVSACRVAPGPQLALDFFNRLAAEGSEQQGI